MPDGTGIERISEWCFKAANRFIPGVTGNRCKCVKVEVFEHENNSAIYVGKEEPFAPATKEAVTQEEVPEEVTKADPKDLTKPPFQPKVSKDKGEPWTRPDTKLWPEKKKNTWLGDTSWGL